MSTSKSFSDRLRSAMKTGGKPAKRVKYTPPAEFPRSSDYWDFKRDGLTKSSLEVFLRCREQFRLQYVEGYQGRGFKMPFVFGNLLHWLIARHLDPKIKRVPITEQTGLYYKMWLQDNKSPTPQQKEVMEEALTFMEALWPYYTSTWDQDQLWQWLLVEDPFKVTIPEADTIVRGIFDGVVRKDSGLWIFETKGMSQINEADIEGTLPFNLQNMLYVVAYWQASGELPDGILYNVIRRPGMQMKQTESYGDYRDRLQADIEKRPEHYFMRWEIQITKTQIERWYHEVLIPMLLDVKQWSEGGLHYMNPDALVTKYGRCDLYEILTNNNYAFVERKPVSSRLER